MNIQIQIRLILVRPVEHFPVVDINAKPEGFPARKERIAKNCSKKSWPTPL